MPLRFLDTNIFIRYFTKDDEVKAAKALALLERVERGVEKIITSEMVVFEVVFTLEHSYRLEKSKVRGMVSDILSLRSLRVPGKRLLIRALELHASANISFVDAYNAVSMAEYGVSEIYSWDTDFDKLPGVNRIEPE